jgi:hypothetical protein
MKCIIVRATTSVAGSGFGLGIPSRPSGNTLGDSTHGTIPSIARNDPCATLDLTRAPGPLQPLSRLKAAYAPPKRKAAFSCERPAKSELSIHCSKKD